LAESLGRSHGRSEIESIEVSQIVGHVAARELLASCDHPPAQQTLRDGVAFHGEPLPADPSFFPPSMSPEASRRLRAVIGDVFPGTPPTMALGAGQAARVMTGAALPTGAESVAMVEDLQWWCCTGEQWQPLPSVASWQDFQHATHVLLPAAAVDPSRPARHVLTQGSIYRQGDALVAPGTRLNPVHAGLFASAGLESIPCFKRPRVAVLTTGDELVSAGSRREDGQIYNSNGPMLIALLRQAGIEVIARHHARDDRAEILAWLQSQLGQVDLLITTGAVSAGQKDQLPSCFQQLGVETIFHGVNIKPGKPIFAGHWKSPVAARGPVATRSTWVMGLPGNPISVWVTFQIFVRPVIEKLAGTTTAPLWLSATLDRSGDFRDARLTFWPGRLQWQPSPWAAQLPPPVGGAQPMAGGEPLVSVSAPSSGLSTSDGTRLAVTPLEWSGSPDLRSPVEANSLIYFPTGPDLLPVGSPVSVLLLPD
jgi:molybdopterin molybdotransferase